VLFYDLQTARLVHFLGMAAIVAFLVVHVALALLVPRTLLAMLTGGPVVAPYSPADGDRGPLEDAQPPPSPTLSPVIPEGEHSEAVRDLDEASAHPEETGSPCR
jgi:hypothetical protein